LPNIYRAILQHLNPEMEEKSFPGAGDRQELLENLRQGAADLGRRPSLWALAELAGARRISAYVVGGTVRELALGRPSADVDLAISRGTLELAQALAAGLGGTFVLLDREERTARVVWEEEVLDLAEFRAPDLNGDLRGRDFTLNALALDLEAVLGRRPFKLMDPLDGLGDLAQGILRVPAPENFADDPLRLLRGYRFAASHGFRLHPDTSEAVRRYVAEFPRVAGERVHQELFILLKSPRAGAVLKEMDRVGLFDQVFPELEDLRGVEQDGYHHLDVFDHSLAAVGHVEEVLAAPPKFFGELAEEIERYVGEPGKAALLKLAALFHDAGKPRVQERRQDPDRYTFYHHERVGLEIFSQAAARLRFSQAEAKTVSLLIKLHMRPFLLLPAFRQGELTFRALGRLVRAARKELPGMFVLAMADSLAGGGPLKPPDAEAVLGDLAEAAFRFLKERVEPQEQFPRLINGDDLIRIFGLSPGPVFRQLLTAVEEAQWEGRVTDRREALKLVEQLL
jgi:poly(A) polymerase